LEPKRTKVVEISKSFVAKKPISASSIDVSASSSPNQPALDEEKLRLVVQRIVYYGEIKESFHSASERNERGVSQDDIVAMLDGNGRWLLSRTGTRRTKTGSTSWPEPTWKATSWC
jgi:hypothetical protein